jgi:hypothetical protein
VAAITVYSVLTGPAGIGGGLGRAWRAALVLTVFVTAYLWLIKRFETWLRLPAPAPRGAGVLAALVVGVIILTSWLAAAASPVGGRAAARLKAQAHAASRRPVLAAVISGGR